jgi:hypothetical protein
LFMVSLFFFFSSFSSIACLPDLIVVQEWKKKTPSVLCVFFSLNCLPLLRFLSFFFCFSPRPFFFLRRGLYIA